MPAYLKFTAKIQSRDLTLDPASFDFVFACQTITAPTALLAADVSVAIQHFFLTLATGQTVAVWNYFGPSLNPGGGLVWEAYDITSHINGTPHGAPINSGTYTLGGPTGLTGNAMPEGICVALSYRSDYGTDPEFIRTGGVITGRPRSSHRGRLYLGPLDASCFTQDATTKRAKVQTSVMNDFMTSMNKNLLSITDSGSNKWHFSQWSKKQAAIRDLTLIWCDDRPDYQRRRSDQSTTRLSQTVTYP